MYAVPGSMELKRNSELDQPSATPVLPARPALRRRGTLQQGLALETLGHAVEYLVDSRLFRPSEAEAQTDQEAIQLLMRLSRAVFAECPEVVPLHRRLRDWIVGAQRRPGRA